MTNEVYIISARKTIQVSEDSWERCRLNLMVNNLTTIEDIIKWAQQKQADMFTICIEPVENINQPVNS